MDNFLSTIKTKLIKYAIWAVISGGVSFMGLVYGIYHAGQKNVQAKWDAANLKTEQQIAELKAKSEQVTEKIVVQYVDKIKEVKIKGDTIVKYSTKYITKEADNNCIIPNNFILLHDAAVDNIVPKEPQ